MLEICNDIDLTLPIGVHWSPLESIGVHWSPLELNILYDPWWSPLELMELVEIVPKQVRGTTRCVNSNMKFTIFRFSGG